MKAVLDTQSVLCYTYAYLLFVLRLSSCFQLPLYTTTALSRPTLKRPVHTATGSTIPSDTGKNGLHPPLCSFRVLGR